MKVIIPNNEYGQEIRNQWGYALYAMPWVEVYVIAPPDAILMRPYHKATKINSVSEVDGRIMVLSSLEAKFAPGVINFYDITTQPDDWFFFGSDHANLNPDDFEGTDHEFVYLPCGQIYSAQTFAVVAMEWKRQNG
jgi:tRNA(Leu) C34 or U34 (ribose-2'-O)-methylase TrmL